MPRRPSHKSVEWLIKQIDAAFKTLHVDLQSLDLRQKVLRLVELRQQFSDLGVSVVHEAGIRARGARERIRLYLVAYEGVVIDGAELQVVSGISEYARRVRELRVECGYQIASGASPDPEVGIDLRPEEYVLVSARPDRDAARRWHVANRVRRAPAGSQERLLTYLLENVGQVVTTDELAYVAKDAHEFGRRVRELRTEQGYLIATRFTGRPDLSVGQYVLESADRRAEPHDRHVALDIEKAVYARDESTCRSCGWNHEKWQKSDPRILELHHIEKHAGGGPNTADNLVVLCSKCHDDAHAGRIVVELRRGVVKCTRRTGRR